MREHPAAAITLGVVTVALYLLHWWRRTAQSGSIPKAQPGLLLEHINLNIPDEERAIAFYRDGLGGVVNPKTSNARQLHINLGASQFHLLHRQSVRRMEPVTVGQVWAGHIVLWSADPLERVVARLSSVVGVRPFELRGHSLRCVCPWGNSLLIEQAPVGFTPAGQHAGGCGAIVGMPRVVHLVQRGAAVAIATFFSRVLLVQAHVESGTQSVFAIVNFSSGQVLAFEEHDDAPPADAYDRDKSRSDYHVCFYLPTFAVFEASFRAAEAVGALFANERFEGGPPEFANALDIDAAVQCGQFRVKDLRHPDSGQLGLVLEIEVRSPSHVSCPLRHDIPR